MHIEKSEPFVTAAFLSVEKGMKIISPESLDGPPSANISTKEKLSTDQVLFFQRGRDAIHHLCQIIGVGKGDYILAPALICRSAVDPIMATGAWVQFIEMASDLNYDQTALEAAFIRYRPKALLAVHHFGKYPRLEQYKALCDRFGSILIEDRCHSLPLSTNFREDIYGDYAIYSLRKFLPVPDGGMLISRKGESILPSAYDNLSFGTYGKFFLRHISKRIFYSGLYNPYALQQQKKRLRESQGAKVNCKLNEENLQEHGGSYGLPLREASKPLTKWLNPENLTFVANKHRHNYRQMASSLHFDKVGLFVDDFFNEKSVPVAFPILDSSNKVDLLERLRAWGIGAYTWPRNDLPAVVRGNYPEAERLAKHLVMLPIHYGLNEDDLSYVASIVKREVESPR